MTLNFFAIMFYSDKVFFDTGHWSKEKILSKFPKGLHVASRLDSGVLYVPWMFTVKLLN